MNADARSDTKALGIVVREQVGIAGSEPFTHGPPRGDRGERLTFDAMLTATGGTARTRGRCHERRAPAGSDLADGAISGTATTAGVYRFTATVTDSEGRVANYPATHRRRRQAGDLDASPSSRHGRQALLRPRSRRSAASSRATWRIVRGPLPRGVRFDRTTGLLFGIPTRPGRYRVTFEATDALGVKAKKTLSIFVVAAPKPKKPTTG